MTPVTVTYRFDGDAAAARSRAEALRLEQSVELPLDALPARFLEPGVLPEVVGVESEDSRHHRITVAFPADAVGDDAAQLLNVLFGNSSLQPDLALVDLQVPDALMETFRGPRHGIAGWRALVDAPARPLTSTALKPVGLTAAELAELCETFALAGIDVIKDDHGWDDRPGTPFQTRLDACLSAVDRANARTGRCSVYAPHVSGPPGKIERQLSLCRARGVPAVLVSPMLFGAPVLQEIASRPDSPVVLAHPALAGGTRIEPGVLVGTLFRLFGADGSVFPHHGGRFAYDAPTCRSIARKLTEAAGGVRPSLPTPAGGMSVERVPEIVDFYGRDVMLLIGGSLYRAGARLGERSREFVDAVARAGDP